MEYLKKPGDEIWFLKRKHVICQMVNWGCAWALLRFVVESATFVCLIDHTGKCFLKLFGLASGHPIVSAVETLVSYVLISAMLVSKCQHSEGLAPCGAHAQYLFAVMMFSSE